MDEVKDLALEIGRGMRDGALDVARMKFRLPEESSRVIRPWNENNRLDLPPMLTDCREWLKNHEGTDYRRAEKAFDLIQADTLFELWMADEAMTGDRKENMQKLELDQSNPDMAARVVVFTLLSNLFNRGDELIETALRNIDTMKADVVGGVFTKGVAAIGDGESAAKRITPQEMLLSIANIAKESGIDDQLILKHAGRILEAHTAGLKKFKNGEPMSLAETIRYRVDTVGEYFTMLGEVMLPDSKGKRYQYITQMMEIQLRDDITDIAEDLNSQPNPFAVILRDAGELNRYLKGGPLRPQIRNIPGYADIIQAYTDCNLRS